MLKRGRLPWLVRSPRPMLVATLRPFAAAGWTARDVEVATQTRLDADTYSPPRCGPDRPVAYLRWLLNDTDLAAPPAQLAAAAAAAQGAELAARVAADRDAAAAERSVADQARGGTGHRAARRVVDDLARRAGRRRDVDPVADAIARATERDAARAGRPVIPPPAEADHDRQCAGCGTLSPTVLVRTALPRPAPLCASCWEPMRPLWT